MSRSLTPLLLSCILLAPATAQTYGNATYNRLSIVTQFHTREFSIDTTTVMNEYMKGIIRIPYYIGIGFFLLLLIFEVSLCCRWCCDWCRCIQQSDDSRESILAFFSWAKAIKSSRNRLRFWFFLSISLCLICCAGFLVCREYFIMGSDQMLESNAVMYGITRDLENSGNTLLYLGNSIVNGTVLALQSCPEAVGIFNYTDIYLDSVDEYNQIIDPIPGDLTDQRQFAEDGSNRIQKGLLTLFFLFLEICILNVVAFCWRKRLLMRLALGIGLIVIHATLAVWMGSGVMLVSE
jgi:hypothetical protein